MHFGLFEFDFVGFAVGVPERHFVVHSLVLSEFGLHFEDFEVSVVDAVGLANEFLVALEELQVTLFDGNAVVFILHLIIIKYTHIYQIGKRKAYVSKTPQDDLNNIISLMLFR